VVILALVALVFAAVLLQQFLGHLDGKLPHRHHHHTTKAPLHAPETLALCKALHAKPGPSPTFHSRTRSDRYEEGTPPLLLLNAHIWTGEQNGTEVFHGDILLDRGMIKYVGTKLLKRVRAMYNEKELLEIVDLGGAWVTPGIVDMHSHIGDDALPALNGAADGNSFNGPILPWLRSLDGLNTHDSSYELSAAGGVTTSLVLPGSANAIGGQGFTIKLRKTSDRSASALLLEPPLHINDSYPAGSEEGYVPWRQLK
jgi:hypothetical protein